MVASKKVRKLRGEASRFMARAKKACAEENPYKLICLLFEASGLLTWDREGFVRVSDNVLPCNRFRPAHMPGRNADLVTQVMDVCDEWESPHSA